jgi:NitT/TauT family transport system substrate-binding protein
MMRLLERSVYQRIAVLAACAVLAASAGPLPAVAQDDTLVVVSGSPSPGLNGVVDDIANLAGFFKAEHLNVQTEYAPGAAAAAQLVASGKGDVTTGSFEPAMIGYEKGLHLQFFLARGSRYGYVLGVLSDSPIRTLADFKGATIGEVTAGSATELVSNSMLAGAGLKKSDYAYAPIGLGAQAIDAIVHKRVAGVTFPYIELGTYSVVANISFRVWRHPILNSLPNFGYASSPATVEAKGDVLKRYCRALVEASLFLRLNPEAAARMYLEARGAKFSEDDVRIRTRQLTVLEGEFPAADPADTRIGYISPNDVRLYAQFMLDSGLTHQALPVAEFVTNRFVAYANAFDHKALALQAKTMR